MTKRNRGRWIGPAKNTLQLKVTLSYIRPPIWRRVLVPDNFSLGDLHWVLQTTMGWTNSHLHDFRIGPTSYGMKTDETEHFGLEITDEESVLLHQVIGRKGQKFTYLYDFGDSWRHDLLVEKIEPAPEPHPHAVCLAGKRAGPPEDCGGVPGYDHMLRVLQSAKTADDREFRDWVGDYDPEHFDLDEVNRLLRPAVGKTRCPSAQSDDLAEPES
jgi:hypothetical protein